MMVVIAALAPIRALARYPIVLGLVTLVGTIALLVALSIRGRRYDLVAWLLILYPLVPLLTLYLHSSLATGKIVSRSTPFFDGLIGLSDVCGLLYLLAHFGCVVVLTHPWRGELSEVRRAAKWLVFVMPPTWGALIRLRRWGPIRDA
jgi:hypothetical protein